jgi:outer membrane biosynthesis protein TonB
VRLDRGEAQGTAAALVLHAVLVVALTSSLARVPSPAEPPPVQVEFVDSDEVALTASAPTPATAPPLAQAPAPTEEPTPATPEPQPAPTPPPPLVQPIARPTPAPIARSLPPRPAPPQPRPAPPRQSRIGDDFLKGIPNPNADLSPRSASPGAATFSAAAKASVDTAIKRQIQPCANRQPTLGPGADRIRVTVNLRLDRSGRLSRPPALVRTAGVDEDNARFEDLAYDQAVAVFRACAPLRLPPELYSTAQGGWGNINLTYAAK